MCKCEEYLYISLIYGTNIPCRHQLLLKAKLSIQNAKEQLAIDENNIKINKLVQIILQSNDFRKKITFQNVENIIKNYQ